MLSAGLLLGKTASLRWRALTTAKLLSNRLAFSTMAVTKQVGTHNGSFHCDEALACFLLRLTNKFSGANVVRTRDLQVLESLDAVVDVGGVYNPTRDRYDHHQYGFNQVLGHGFTIKLSSSGLVYKHYGMEIISKELNLDEGHPNVHRLFLAVYKSFMEAIDGIDNGINQYDIDQPPRYVNNTNLSSRVGRLNLDWMDHDQSSEKENEAFQRAMELAGSEFMDVWFCFILEKDRSANWFITLMLSGISFFKQEFFVYYCSLSFERHQLSHNNIPVFQTLNFHAKSWLPARSIVMECLLARENIDPSKEIMVLTKSCPWKLHIFELEEEMKIDPSIKYVIYQDDRNKTWRVQAVAVSPDKFESRKPLPLHWRGLEYDNLSEVAGIPGCVFVHMSGFIGGNQTYEGALAMARASLVS